MSAASSRSMPETKRLVPASVAGAKSFSSIKSMAVRDPRVKYSNELPSMTMVFPL